MSYDAIIFASDLHITTRPPRCRPEKTRDEFVESVANKLSFLNRKAKELNAITIIAGDVFHRAREDPMAEQLAIKYLPRNCYIIAGQHDLPHHNADMYEWSSLAVLDAARPEISICAVSVGNVPLSDFHAFMDFVPWGQYAPETPAGTHFEACKNHFIATHRFVYDEEPPWPGCEGVSAQYLLDMLHNHDYVVTGDNHQTFSAIGKHGSMLLNPGSMMRMTADQAEHEPGFYVLSEQNEALSVDFVKYEPEEPELQTEHIEQEKRRESALQAYVDRFGEEVSVDIDFQSKLDTIKSGTNEQIKNIIEQCETETKG